MDIYLIRHGQTNWNKEKKIQGTIDIELNEIGINEAKEVSNYFLKEKIIPDKIYCSDKKRAIKTATIIAEKFLQKPIITKDLQEIDLGIWKGKTWDEVIEEYPNEFNLFEGENCKFFKGHMGESYVDVIERVMKRLKIICKEEKYKKNIFIVTHGAVIMTVRLFLKDKDWTKKDTSLIVKNLGYVKISSKEILDY